MGRSTINIPKSLVSLFGSNPGCMINFITVYSSVIEFLLSRLKKSEAPTRISIFVGEAPGRGLIILTIRRLKVRSYIQYKTIAIVLKVEFLI